jgi:DNA-directed RNA polymerase subunit RPC12/RpoP
MILGKIINPKDSNVPDACPHCGEKLSPWQQVLLGVDRALMCKNCWYRIVLDVIDEQKNEMGQSETPPKE